MSGYENEENTESCVDHDCKTEDHQSTLVEQPSNIMLLNAGEAHESIFTEANKSEDGVEAVLVRNEGVDTDCVWKDDL